MSKSKLTTTIDSDLLHKLKIAAAKEDVKVNYILEKLIAKYLEQKETNSN